MKYFKDIPEGEMDRYEVIDSWSSYLARDPRNNYSHLEANPELSRKIFKSPVILSGIWKKEISFSECYFEEGVQIKGVLEEGIVFDCCSIGHLADVDTSSEIKGQSRLTNCQIEHLCLVGTRIDYLDIDGCTIQNLQMWGIQLKNFRVAGTMPAPTLIRNWFIDLSVVSGVISTEPYTSIGKLSICGDLQQNTSLLLEDVDIGILDIFAFRNTGTLRFKNLSTMPTDASIIHIAYSNLGKADFFNCNLGSFSHVFISASQLVDCTFINMRWPSAIRAYIYQPTSKRLSLAGALNRWDSIAQLLPNNADFHETFYHQRETYRQIKYALSKQGDTVNEQHFHVLEMRAYDRALNWKTSFWTKLIIKLSFWTSEFGQSVFRPLGWLIIFHLALLVLAMLSGAITANSSLKDTLAYAINGFIHHFFVLINPLHKINDNEFLGWTIIIDVAMRISSSYMIYNIIRATRRFIK